MTRSMVTIHATIANERVPEATRLLEELGNPASADIREKLATRPGCDDGVHFLSIVAVAAAEGDGHLLMELSADGDKADALSHIARILPCLEPVFELASDRGHGPLGEYLAARKLAIGNGWTGRPGLLFDGTPRLSVGKILRNAAIANEAARVLGAQDGDLTALDRLRRVREAVPHAEPHDRAPGGMPPTGRRTQLPVPVGNLIVSFCALFLWPLFPILVVVLVMGVVRLIDTGISFVRARPDFPHGVWLLLQAFGEGVSWLLLVAAAFLLPALIVVGLLYRSLRTGETRDVPDDVRPDPEVLARMMRNENHGAQNHMVSLTRLKDGLVRRFTLRLSFWLVGELTMRCFRTGFLGTIGTIHFARWVLLPSGRDLVFLSNYGGSWESYLEDFITKAHDGLTAIWSNTKGFPRTRNLFQDGATDGERFKRFARRSMEPTAFWYSAYPTLTTANIRTHDYISRGLVQAETDEEAKSWLALFGSSSRPAAKLESSQIQSLVFGGLGFLPEGRLLLVDLEGGTEEAKIWLRTLLPEIAFDDGRRIRQDAVLSMALGSRGLERLGLPEAARKSFPQSFLDGMASDARARVLGDRDGHAGWWWSEKEYDVALLVYAKDPTASEIMRDKVAATTTKLGHRLVREVRMAAVADEAFRRTEPFGFVDGVSQPVIRGTYRSLRNADSIHLVEPGEFILGYPDNRGNIPPGPWLDAREDPDAVLPIACGRDGEFASDAADLPREIGRNGSFLVIRQLEQDSEAFGRYCEEEAARLENRLSEPYSVTAGFVAAKILGRWRDGSSLVRNPYTAFTDSGKLERNPTSRPAAGTAGGKVPKPVEAAMTSSAEPPAVAEGRDHELDRVARRAPDNDFLFGTEDPEGLRCPFGAHVRRANPRDSLEPGSKDQIDISNRHRILRVGRAYVPQNGQESGLLFMCLNGDIERQFEFVQQTWLDGESFHGLTGERDPVAGSGYGATGMTIPTRDGPIRLKPFSKFVTTRGGGYFFLPGKRLLEFLTNR